ncbi:MAG: NUDIX domain-containing protein [Ruminococcaceae bacterium]|nr:NUDIX domain-containing protein [Oscillospiraceae bacterium]
MVYEKSCGSVLYRNNDELRILVIKQARNGNWSFPKGHVENGETEIETAVREVKEEVGISVQPLDGFREVICYNPRSNIQKEVVYFVSLSPSPTVKIQKEEVSDYKWVRPNHALKTLTFKNDREVLKKALKFLRENGKI